MAEQASETQVYKLSVLAQRQHLPSLPGQEEGTTYGVVWSSFPMPAHGSCYVVKFNNARSISFLAYIDDQGAVFPVDQPITLAPAACPDFAGYRTKSVSASEVSTQVGTSFSSV